MGPGCVAKLGLGDLVWPFGCLYVLVTVFLVACVWNVSWGCKFDDFVCYYLRFGTSPYCGAGSVVSCFCCWL